MKREPLKPCPFCGGEASLCTKGREHWSDDPPTVRIFFQCGNCRASSAGFWCEHHVNGDYTDVVKAARDEWNRRAESGSGDALDMIEDAPAVDVAPRAEVASEVIDDIWNFVESRNGVGYVSIGIVEIKRRLYELKDKYTEEQLCNQTTKQK